MLAFSYCRVPQEWRTGSWGQTNLTEVKKGPVVLGALERRKITEDEVMRKWELRTCGPIIFRQ